MKKYLFKSIISILLSFTVVLGLSLTAFADNGESIKLKKQNTSVNAPFAVENMFPGDRVQKDYTVKINHKKTITLYYHTDIHTGYEKLAEVLMTKIEIPAKSITLYDGLMKDMPEALEHSISADETEIVYRITVYLDTSVGNDYQYKELKADFRWWYLEEEWESTPNPTPDKDNTDDEQKPSGGQQDKPAGARPDTGDITNFPLVVSVMVVSGIILIILLVSLKKKEKEVNENG